MDAIQIQLERNHSRSVIRAVCLAAFLVLVSGGKTFSQRWLSHDTVRVVTLKPDKSSYQLFEPIIIEVSVTNETDRLQDFGSPALQQSGTFRYELLDPAGNVVPRYQPRPLAEVSRAQLGYAPGQTRSQKMLLNAFRSVWDTTGTYTLRALAASDPFTPLQEVAAAVFEVTPLHGVPSFVVERLAWLSQLLYKGQIQTGRASGVTSAVETVLSEPDLPAHVTEYAHFLSAAASIEPTSAPDLVEAAWDAFLLRYPASKYSSIASHHGMRFVATMNGILDYWSGPFSSFSRLELKVNLDGPSGQTPDSMSSDISAIVPQNSSGRSQRSNPRRGRWAQYGDSTGGVDWISVSLVDTTANPDTTVAIESLFLGTGGRARAEFWDLPRGEYRVIVDHRNHITVASDTLVDFTRSYAEHDFTTGHDDGVNVQREVRPGVYAMWAGDANRDGAVNTLDLLLLTASTDSSGYVQGDLDLDGTVGEADRQLWESSYERSTGAGCDIRQVLYAAECEE